MKGIRVFLKMKKWQYGQEIYKYLLEDEKQKLI